MVQVKNKIDKYKHLSRVDERHVGGEPADSEASLCIYAEEIDIPAISAMLGCEPNKAHRKGEVIKQRPPASIGLWCLDAPKNLSLPDKLSWLIMSTTPDRSIWDRLASQHRIELRCTVFLHSWTEGFEISADSLTEIGSRHWKYGLSMYSAEGNEIVDGFLKGKDKA
jgi:hypothetical protein